MPISAASLASQSRAATPARAEAAVFRRYDAPVTHPGHAPGELIAAARALGESFAAGASARDQNGLLPAAELDAVRLSGITAARLPRAHGGPQLSYTDTAHILLHLAKGDPNVAQVLLPHYTSIERVWLTGTPAQQARYLGAIRHGALISGATTERGHTFRNAIATRLTREAGGLRLNGTKFYSTGGLMADLLRVTAKNEAGQTVSVMLERDRPGVRQHDDWRAMGQRGTASGTTEFVDVAVDEDEVIPFDPTEAGRRHYQAAGTQLLHSTIEVGIALAILDDAVHIGRTTARLQPESGVTRPGDDPYILHTIGNIASRAHTARAALLGAAGVVDAAYDAFHEGWKAGAQPWEETEALLVAASIAVAEAKILCNEAALRSAELLFEVGGASSTLSAPNYDRHWRNARTHSTHDATAYKYKIIGNYYLNDTPPPITMYY